MIPFSLNIETCCLYVIWESKINFGQKFFASPKYALPYTYVIDCNYLAIAFSKAHFFVIVVVTLGFFVV